MTLPKVNRTQTSPQKTKKRNPESDTHLHLLIGTILIFLFVFLQNGSTDPAQFLLDLMEPNITTTTVQPQRNSLELQRQNYPQRVLVATYVFGAKAMNQRRFRMFVETASKSGFEFAIVGDTPPPFRLPPHVRHVHVTWEQIVDRVLEKVFHGGKDVKQKRIDRLKNMKSFYKVCDYKPLFAYLFPEEVEGYQWWGHVDNDMLIGNLTKLIPQQELQYYDIFAGNSGKEPLATWGPFMLYRNVPAVNELFKRAFNLDIFHDSKYYYFDEWGQHIKGPFKQSMTSLVLEHSDSLGLRRNKTSAATMWDIGECGKPQLGGPNYLKLSPTCGECIFQPNNKDGKLLRRTSDDKEVYLCHYQFAKKLLMEDSLNNTRKFRGLLKAGEFRATFRYGFDFIGKTDPRMIELEKEKIAELKNVALDEE